MIELLKDEDLANRKFFHKPTRADGEVLPHKSYVKEFVDTADMSRHRKEPVRFAHQDSPVAIPVFLNKGE